VADRFRDCVLPFKIGGRMTDVVETGHASGDQRKLRARLTKVDAHVDAPETVVSMDAASGYWKRGGYPQFAHLSRGILIRMDSAPP
jgi:hypothetical protein